jgi:hypothetical protein
MMVRRLPVAPRPCHDELLSSWLARVACRYGLSAQELVDHFTAEDECSSPPPPIDDFAPAAEQVRQWAQACGVDPERLRRLALSRRYPRRPRSWYLNRGPQWSTSVAAVSAPVCVGCFDADRAAGRDAWLRTGWRFAERCICPVHGQLLHDRCVKCHRRLSVTFRMRAGNARPVCGRCGQLLAGRAGEGARQRDVALVATGLATQQRITAGVNRACPERDQLEKALATLWAPLDRPASARPALTLWFNEAGWRCPYEARHAVGAETPLGQLPVRWRFLTLLVLDDVFGTEPRVDGAIPTAAAHLARRAAPRRPRGMTRPPQPKPADRILLRSSDEYERLARQILAHPRWIAADRLPERKRDRVRMRLMDAALAGDLPATAGLSPAGKVTTGEI